MGGCCSNSVASAGAGAGDSSDAENGENGTEGAGKQGIGSAPSKYKVLSFKGETGSER